MNEDFVSYELAVKLKACGFDEPCIAQWACEPDGKPMLVGSTAFVFSNAELKGRDVTAPLLYQAQKWLREKKHLSVEPYTNIVANFNYNIVDLESFADYKGQGIGYESYECALAAGISASLELIKKGE